MKTKTIRKVIKAKIDEWIASIEDKEIQKLAKDNTIVTGGSIASMLLKEPVNDFDIYFRTHEATKRIAEYYIARFPNKTGCKMYLDVKEDRIKVMIKSVGVAAEGETEMGYDYFEQRPEGEAGKYVDEVMGPGDIEDTYEETQGKAQETEDKTYRPVFMSTNAITLSSRVQLIIRFFGEPEQIHENYDFIHCTNYWTSWNDELVLRQAALEALLSRELIYVGSKYPVCSIIRLRKFIQRKWTVNAGQILKILLQISALDLTKIEVLEDQLTGVDAAYFIELIAKAKENDPDKINHAYLIEIIDRIF